MSGAIIVTALFGDADFAWLEGLRRSQYPADRNRVPAHLTLFQHLPPSIEPELRERLAEEARAARPAARMAGLMKLEGGLAFRIESRPLEEIRERLADAFHGLLTPADQAPWRPHVTVQNKAEPKTAAAFYAQLSADFVPRPLVIAALASWNYRDGAWEPLSRHAFRG